MSSEIVPSPPRNNPVRQVPRNVAGPLGRRVPPRAAGPKRNKIINNADIVNVIVTDITNAVEKAIGNTDFIVLLVVVAVIIIFHAGDIDKGPFAPFFPKDSPYVIVQWVRHNVMKFFGLICFMPTVYSAPTGKRIAFAAAIAIWVIIVPESGMEQYALQAVLLYLYSHVTMKATKFAIIAVVGSMYFAGWFAIKPVPVEQYVPAPSSTENTERLVRRSVTSPSPSPPNSVSQ